ncbi:MAG: hypothetical protein J7K09_04130 [Desulfuromusa sp.]|nr:hypothetical protein [Desulfuromusa sp.]
MPNPETIYIIGVLIAVISALIWSFILDKNKPQKVGELIAKFMVRGLFIAFFYVIVVGFIYLAFGTFPGDQ